MSKRTLERRLSDLEQDTEETGSGVTLAYSTPGTDELEDGNGNPIDRDEISGVLIELTQSLVITRERAEQEGRTILGPTENAAEDAVRVPVDLDEYPHLGSL